MILCICPSPAIDVTYHVDTLHRGGSTRVRSLSRRAGGKAVNVACVLHAVAADSHVLAPVGGPAGSTPPSCCARRASRAGARLERADRPAS